MPEEEDNPYRVEVEEHLFKVLDATGQVTLVCQDEGSATQYAVLLKEAYRRGFKAGYRAGKKS